MIQSFPFMTYEQENEKANKYVLPGLVNIQKAIEHGHRNSGFTQLQNGDFP
jgi:hypothetical protein